MTTTNLPDLPANYATAQKLIDEAHAQDPKTAEEEDVPAELLYARQMTRWLAVRCPDASPALQIACRAQHFRRWEIPRASFPMTRVGYLSWRAKQKTQAAEKIKALLLSSAMSLPDEEVERIARLVRKENMASNEETQILEDVACLVFLDGQLDDFEKRDDVDEEKMIGILRKTWGKMSERGREIALDMRLSERSEMLVGKALGG